MRAASPDVSGWKVLLFLSIAIGVHAATAAPPSTRFAGGVPVQFGPDSRISVAPSAPAGTIHRETSMASGPKKNSKLLVGAFMELYPTVTPNRPCAFSITSDAGSSWSEVGTIPLEDLPGLNACSDPSVASDADGNFYYAYVEQNQSAPFQFPTGDIRVARASGHGAWFQDTATVFDGGENDYPDKPYLTVDDNPDSPYAGTVYVTYTEDDLVDGNEWILVSASRDGARTWSEPIAVDGPPDYPDALLGSMPAVGPDGTAYVFWAKFSYTEPYHDIRFSRSTDGGRTWSPAANVASARKGSGFFFLKNADPTYGTKANRGLGVNGFPSGVVAADGSVFVAWTDFQDGTCAPQSDLEPFTPCHNADVRLAVSHDHGETWSVPVKPTDESGDSDQFFPWLAAHPDGLVSLAWLDRRLDPDNVNYDVYYTNTYDGASFLPNVRVTGASSLLGTTRGIGDYNGIAATAKEVLPIWGDLRDGTQVQVFSASGRLDHPAEKLKAAPSPDRPLHPGRASG